MQIGNQLNVTKVIYLVKIRFSALGTPQRLKAGIHAEVLICGPRRLLRVPAGF
jgi:hypothetical protein